MKKIIVVGAGGFGKEVAWMAKRCGREVLGFLDSTPDKQNTKIMGLDVLGPIEHAEQFLDYEFVIAIGNPRARKKIIDVFFKDERFSFATLIDPSSIVGENISIATGSIICAGVILTVDISVGKHTIININSTIGHDVIIKDFVTIAPNASVSGNIVLNDFVEIGTNATLREKLNVYEGAMIGMGAVLTKDVEKNHVMVGNPAKLLKIMD
ncbi:acetyltransferase [Acinetobacter sp. C32I]|uniref:acetyltransferase n=1 Tax=Acinetobacter sp. C32I TaxID=2950074 RepID=UPI0020370937|nr:acetyltransferase [Acinetobacter sp. C32I]USA52719.1 acetyltransferase [Acinetobacter sp. C32I]